MSLIKYILLAIVILPLNVFAQERSCLDSTKDDVDAYLAEKMAGMNYDPTDIPSLMIISSDIDLNITAKGSVKRNIFVEGFIKVERGSYRLIPGLGMTINATNDSLFYVCLVMQGQSPSNFIRMIHLERQGLFTKRFKTETVGLSIRPLTDGTLLLGGLLKVLKVADPKKIDVRPANAIDLGINQFIQSFLKAGVEQVEIRPTEIELTLSTELLSTIKVPRSKVQHPLKSSWLTAE